LVFTPANYATPQSVRVVAATDEDAANDAATFSVSSSALTTELVKVSAYDTVGSSPLFTSMNIDSNGVPEMRLHTIPGNTYVLDGTTDFLSWLALVTNVATTNSVLFSDPGATNFNYRFYRARRF
jgi:hypothetical protein